MSQRPPTRFSPDHVHTQFGIKNWLKKIGIEDHDLRERLKQAFLEDYNFDFTKGKEISKNNFISKRWNEFTNYVQKNKQFFK